MGALEAYTSPMSFRLAVDLPVVGPDFQSNVSGIYIAGELGGMGLVRKAIEQGHRAVDAISKIGHFGRSDKIDLVIVGAGLAGGLGFEPRLAESESAVLPLDDPPTVWAGS